MRHKSNRLKKFLRARLSSKESSGLYLTLSLLILLVAAGTFGAIAEDVVTNDPSTKVDLQLSVWLHQHSVHSITKCLLVITRLHSLLGVTVMTLAVSAWLWIRRLRLWVLTLALAVFGGMLLNFLLKLAFERPRPRFDNPLLNLTTYSFPSGHTLMATVFYGTLGVLIMTRLRSWLWRALVITLAAGMILLVGFSRIYLGVHYLSDVLAAIAEGLAWLAFCLLALAALQRRWTFKQDQ